VVNYVNEGNTVTVVAPYTVTSGLLVLVGSIVGIAAFDAASGANVEVAVEGVFDVPKTSALAINAGDLLYLDDTNHVLNKTSSAQKLVGVALTTVANPSPTIRVRLNGGFTT
jgi:predicted RecA/RadA family phage recombinase